MVQLPVAAAQLATLSGVAAALLGSLCEQGPERIALHPADPAQEAKAALLYASQLLRMVKRRTEAAARSRRSEEEVLIKAAQQQEQSAVQHLLATQQPEQQFLPYLTSISSISSISQARPVQEHLSSCRLAFRC